MAKNRSSAAAKESQQDARDLLMNGGEEGLLSYIREEHIGSIAREKRDTRDVQAAAWLPRMIIVSLARRMEFSRRFGLRKEQERPGSMMCERVYLVRRELRGLIVGSVRTHLNAAGVLQLAFQRFRGAWLGTSSTRVWSEGKLNLLGRGSFICGEEVGFGELIEGERSGIGGYIWNFGCYFQNEENLRKLNICMEKWKKNHAGFN